MTYFRSLIKQIACGVGVKKQADVHDLCNAGVKVLDKGNGELYNRVTEGPEIANDVWTLTEIETIVPNIGKHSNRNQLCNRLL